MRSVLIDSYSGLPRGKPLSGYVAESCSCHWNNHLANCTRSHDYVMVLVSFFFQAEDGIRDGHVTGVQTCALPISKSMLLDIENNIKLLENTFSILLGETPQNIERSTLSEQEINVDLNIGVPIQLLSNRPDVMAAEYALINSFELTNAARSSFYPSLRLTANGGLQSLDFDDFFNTNSLFASIVGSLTQPIFNGRQIRTQYEVSKAQQEAALLNYKQSILLASKDVSDALYT